MAPSPQNNGTTGTGTGTLAGRAWRRSNRTFAGAL
nr:MAG TPA: hypothetical protein [Caudoviricetes sp.]